MEEDIFQLLLNKWSPEISASLVDNRSSCVALFSGDGHLIFANSAMSSLFVGEPVQNFINPTFEKLKKFAEQSNSPAIYEGFLTLGDYDSVNTSILVHVYQKNSEFLIIGGMDVEQLVLQNKNLHHLNHEINNLQRQLIKEKSALQDALNKLNDANTDLQELVATKDKFFSIIAHDLKNPFNVLLGFSELLAWKADEFDPEKIKEISGNILSTSRQTYKLLENLLTWSRLQSGKLQPVPEEIIPSQIIAEVVEGCEENARSKSIELRSFIDNDHPLFADKEMIKTVIRNLVTNALKYTYPEGRVTVSVQLEGENLLFSVSDTGFGIETDHLHELFNVDCKLLKDGTGNEKGTGLGLILCKEFVEKHYGRIWVESEPGQGSNFKFTLPLPSEDA